MSSEPIPPAADVWSPLVYECLRGLAGRALRRESPDHTLQPTALVHEAYLRLRARDGGAPTDHRQFVALAARTLRAVLVDHARRRRARKRGGDRLRLQLDESDGATETPVVDLIALDDALERLAAESTRAARVVELRWFGGLSVDETAGALGVSPRTVDGDWRYARAWLGRALRDGDDA